MARVLVVDDTSFMRSMLRDILIKNGFEVAGEAEDGEQAMEKYISLRPDLVTMDIIMPHTDGVTAASNILRYDPQARIVVVSAIGQESMVTRAMEIGARAYITKPFSPVRVVETLKKTLEG